MRKRCWLCSRARRRAALKVALLLLPALFWSAVFAALAGARPLERVVERVPDGVQVAIAFVCPLVACALGVAAVGGGGRGGGEGESVALGRATVAAGLALLIFAALAALRPS